MDRADVYRSTLKYFLAPVADLLYDDESVTEVLINGPNQIYCERRGRLELVPRQFADEHTLLAAVRNLAEYVGRGLDDRHSLDARLPEPEQFRVHAILPPTSRRGVCVSIRKFRRSDITLDWLVTNGSLSAAAAEYLALMVKTHRNLVVAGGTGSGKTSLLNALSGEIPHHERVVVIEDSSELRLQQPHAVYLEAKPAGPNGEGGVSVRDLFVDSLRMRPDRILVGEVRRGEALDLIQSMLSGHDGALSTVHASSPLAALVRLETLSLINDVDIPVYVARAQVASAIHVIVQIARLADGSRRVTAISELAGLSRDDRYRLRPIFAFRSTSRTGDGGILGNLSVTGRRSRFGRIVRESEFAASAAQTGEVFQEKLARPSSTRQVTVN